MDVGHLKKLNHYHIIFLTHMSMSGYFLLSLPHNLSAVGYNLWIIPLFFGVMAQLTVIPMIMLGKKYPNLSLYEIQEQLLGKWLGKLPSVIFILYGILMVAAETENYVGVIQTVALPDSSARAPTFILFVIMIYIVLGGIKSVARFSIAGFFMVAWMIYYLQWGAMKGTLSHLFPLFDFTFSELIIATEQSFPSMLGYELVLFYFPYIIHQHKTLKHVSIGIWITVFFYVVVTFTSIVYFSPWQLENLRFPVLNLYKAVELSFVERIENLGIALWIFLILGTLTAYLWMAKKGLDVLFHKRRKRHVFACAVLAFFIIEHSLFNQFETEIYYEWTPFIGYGVILYPSILLLLHWMKQRLGRLT
jgi:spore germination protein AB